MRGLLILAVVVLAACNDNGRYVPIEVPSAPGMSIVGRSVAILDTRTGKVWAHYVDPMYAGPGPKWHLVASFEEPDTTRTEEP